MSRYIEGFESGNFGLTTAPFSRDNIDDPFAQESGVLHKDDILEKLTESIGNGVPSISMIEPPRYGNYVYNIVNNEELKIPVSTIYGLTRSIYIKFRFQIYRPLNTSFVKVWGHNPASYSTPSFDLVSVTGKFYPNGNTYMSTNQIRSRQCISECQWYLFEMYLVLSTDNSTYDGEYEIRIDGQTILKETNCRTNALNRTQYITYISLNSGSSLYHTFIDDIAMDSTNSMDIKSNGKIVRYAPTSDGSANQWTIGRAGSDLTGNFYASYLSDIDADTSDGSPTGVSSGGASVVNRSLDLAHDDVRYVTYDAASNIGSASQGCIRFQLKKAYPGFDPTSSQILFCLFDSTAAGNENRILFYQSTNRYTYLRIYDPLGVLLVNASFGSTTISDTDWQEFEINWDLVTGEHRLYVNGTQKGSTGTGTGSRNLGDYFRVGAVGPTVNTAHKSYFYMRNLIIYDEVQHTGSSYTQVEWGQYFASGSDHYDYIDDKWKRHRYMDYTWVEANAQNKNEMYNISVDGTATIGNVYHVQSHVRARKFGTPYVSYITPYIYYNFTDYTIEDIYDIPIGSYQVILTPIPLNPTNGSEWQPGDFDTIQYCIKTDPLPI